MTGPAADGAGPRGPEQSAAQPEGAIERVRLITLNLFGMHGPWPARKALLRDGLAAETPDVLALQEVLRHGGATQVDDLAADLGYHVAYGAACAIGAGRDFGNAILSRFPLLDQRSIALPNPLAAEPRALLYALCDTPAGLLPVFCTHLSWELDHSHARCAQVYAIAAEVAATGAALREAHGRDRVLPAVWLGDFNAEQDSDEIRFLRGLHALAGPGGAEIRGAWYQDCYRLAGPPEAGATFARSNPYAGRLREPDRRLDYIFVAGPDHLLRGEPLHSRLCFTAPAAGIFVSDHYGVLAEVQVAPRPRQRL